MIAPIVTAKGGVTILGAGEVHGPVLAQALAVAPLLVAADGGAVRARELGYEIAAAIGDMDSVDTETLASLPADRVHRIDEQETTDFDKCLRNIRAPLILAVGFTGARLDHELAAFATLARHPRRRCILLGPEDVAFLAPRDLSLRLDPGTRVSLFPLGPVQGESTGLRWPIEGIRFSPLGRIGTSNEAVAAEVRMRFSARRMLVLLPRALLDAAVRSLAPGLRAH